MNPTVLSPAIDKTGFFSLDKATSIGKGNIKLKPAVLYLKINLVFYRTPVSTGGVKCTQLWDFNPYIMPFIYVLLSDLIKIGAFH